MIPLELLIQTTARMMKREDHNWLRLLQSTGQPTFLNKQNSETYLELEKKRDAERKENYLKVKMNMLNMDQKSNPSILGAAGGQNY